MAVEVEITGNGTFAGAKSNIGPYTVLEESTPVEASDSSGGVGTISFSAVDDSSRFGSVLLLNDEVTLTDGDRGKVIGKINSLAGNDGILTVTANSRLSALVGTRTADWVSGTLEEVVTYYLGLSGITMGIAVDAAIASIPVQAIGWTADVWTKMKELLVAHGAEITLIKGDIVVRPIRGRAALEINNVNESWNVSNTDLAEYIEVAYYNTVIKTSELVYPVGGWNEDVEIYTVDAGETKTINIPVDVYLSDLVQPVVQDFVDKDETDAVYAVAGNDGFPITAAQWNATGGALSVAVGEDGKSIDVTLHGADGPSAKYAPYRIAMSSGSGNYYSALRIVGTGAAYERMIVRLPTGAGSLANTEVGITVDNIFVNTYGEAMDVAADVAGRFASPLRTITINKVDINKPGSSDNNYNWVTFGQNDDYLASIDVVTFEDFDAEFAGQTFGDYDEFWYTQVENDFDFQAFGNGAGARLQWRRSMYRVRSVTTTESSVNYTAEADTTFGDFDATTEGMTFEEFDALFEGKTFSDFALAPLVNTKPQYDH